MTRWSKWAHSLAGAVSGAALAAGAGSLAHAACKIQSAEVPVVVTSSRILVPAEVNGKKVYFIYDTGAAYSLLDVDAASLLGMGTRENRGLTMYGVGGAVHARSVIFPDLQLGQFHLRNQEMLIADRASHATRSGEPIIGLVGSDIFGAMDVEFDLAHNVLRLLKPSGCDDDDMVYWGAAYSKAPIIWRREGQNVDLNLGLNGETIEAILDTGAPSSTVTLAAAARAGVTPNSPGARRIGVVGGIGASTNDVWIGEFNTVSIGNEKINRVNLMIADLYRQDKLVELGSRLPTAIETNQMLLGLDFVRAHRVLLSRSHNKVYFSYNGGPVFQADGVAPTAAPRPSSSAPSGNSPIGAPPGV